jgi:hypothetical protein
MLLIIQLLNNPLYQKNLDSSRLRKTLPTDLVSITYNLLSPEPTERPSLKDVQQLINSLDQSYL